MVSILVLFFVDAFFMQMTLHYYHAAAMVFRSYLICNEYGCSWDIKFNPNKSYAGTLGGDHPTSMNPVLAGKPLQWAVQLKYLGCTFRCRSCDIDISCFVSK